MELLSVLVGASGMFFLVMVWVFIKAFRKPKRQLGNLKQKVWEMDEKMRNINEQSSAVHKELDDLYKVFVEMERS